jgi:hypothetical protein
MTNDQYEKDNVVNYFDPGTRVGIEIELEGERPCGLSFPLPIRWEAKTDGSLYQGTEFVTDGQGVEYALLPPVVKELIECIRETELHPAQHAGLHIHVSEPALGGGERYGDGWSGPRYRVPNTPQWRAWVRNMHHSWCNIERQMFEHMPPDPERARFCKRGDGLHRWGHHPWDPNDIGSIGERYQAMNFAALTLHGTIEFRLFNSSKKEEEIMAAVEFCARLSTYSLKHILRPSATFEGTLKTIGVPRWAREVLKAGWSNYLPVKEKKENWGDLSKVERSCLQALRSQGHSNISRSVVWAMAHTMQAINNHVYTGISDHLCIEFRTALDAECFEVRNAWSNPNNTYGYQWVRHPAINQMILDAIVFTQGRILLQSRRPVTVNL